MGKQAIKVPAKGTYKAQLFDYWSSQYRHTSADYSAYIALNFAGVLDACRTKWSALIQYHQQHLNDPQRGLRHSRALARLQNTMSGAAMAYESGFRQH